MKTELMTATETVAYAIKLARVDVVANYTDMFSDEIIRNIESVCDIFNADPSSTVSYAIASELMEKRSFFTAMPDSIDDAFHLSYMRLPIVSVSFNNILSLRDAGFLIFMPESNQEILDNIIQAYKICEDNKVLLPSVVNIDFPKFRDPVSVPSEKSVDGFLSKLRLNNKINFNKPLSFGVTDGKECIAQRQKAMLNAKKLIDNLDQKWLKKSKRTFGPVERYCMDDAEFAFVMAGSDSTTCKSAINKLREMGEKVGLLRLRVIRPWPDFDLDVKRVAVIDNEISLGSAGVLYIEIKRNYHGFCSNYISSSHMSEKDFFEIFERLKKNEEERVWL